MTRTNRSGRRGSAILMAVGLLVLLAMVAATFVITTYMDKRESLSISAVSPIRSVAINALHQVVMDRQADLYLSGNTPYGAADTVGKLIDYPGEQADPVLAANAPQQDSNGNWEWPHLSHLPGLAAAVTNVPLAVGGNPNPGLVNVSGFTWNDYTGNGSATPIPDAIPFDSGMVDRAGRKYYLAVRVVDASGLLNLSVAYRPHGATDIPTGLNPAAALGKTMNVTDVSWLTLMGGASAFNGNYLNGMATSGNGRTTDKVVQNWWLNYGRRVANPDFSNASFTYTPWDAGDMLTLVWGGAFPDTRAGKMIGYYMGVMGGNAGNYEPVFETYRPYSTIWSSERIAVPQRAGSRWLQNGQPVQVVRADLNNSDLPTLYTACYNALPPNSPPYSNDDSDMTVRCKTAAQLAANIVSYRNPADEVAVASIDGTGNATQVASGDTTPYGTLIYGVKRWPYLTKQFLKRYTDAGGVVHQYSAIELFNPYQTDLDLTGYAVMAGTNLSMAGWPTTLLPQQRVVIVSDPNALPVFVSGTPPTLVASTVGSNPLDLSQDVRLLRPRGAAGTGVCDVLVAHAHVDVQLAGTNLAFRTYQTNDTITAANWALNLWSPALTDVAHDYTNGTVPGGNATAATTKLGKPNDSPPVAVSPCPVYIRNGMFLNVGDVNRIFCVGPGFGPTPGGSFSEQLTNTTAIDNGHLPVLSACFASTSGAVPSAPPVGCLLTDYVMVDSPQADGIDNDGIGGVDNLEEDTTWGKINLNTASPRVLKCIPGCMLTVDNYPYGTTNPDVIANAIVAYRDGQPYQGTGDVRQVARNLPGLTNLRVENGVQGPGFATVGELAVVLRAVAQPMPQNGYVNTNGQNAPGFNYALVPSAAGAATDDGLDKAIQNDLTKSLTAYTWMSNYLTVRSDVYIAYISVLGSTLEAAGTATGAGSTFTDAGKNWQTNQFRGRTVVSGGQVDTVASNTANTLTLVGSGGVAGSYQVMNIVRHYVAVIDRSNCHTAGDCPKVLMFSELK